jgi:hypothetical protein
VDKNRKVEGGGTYFKNKSKKDWGEVDATSKGVSSKISRHSVGRKDY